MRFSPALV